MQSKLPFKISSLIFIQNQNEEFLLIKRSKSPNKDCWSPIGGKLDFSIGESPYECAIRETKEEIDLTLKESDINCFGYISEKNYENSNHWLMFLFNCNKKLEKMPKNIEEGYFSFFSRDKINNLEIPITDKKLLWPYYDSHKNSFIGLRADCSPHKEIRIFEELSIH